MYKFFFLLLLLSSFAISGYYQPSNTNDLDQIHWDADRKLQWTDFRAAPDIGSHYTALTAWAVGYRMNTITRGVEVEMDVDVNCYFDPTQSWVKMKKATDALLNHEQTHFNIGELLARDFRKRIQETAFSAENPLDELEALYDRTFLEYVDLSNEYDEHTMHGLAKEAQAEWDVIIQNKLKALEAYSL